VELEYWEKRVRDEGTLKNDHYQHFYTEFFGLTKEDYRGKSVLDIGCGPRGSLEWADMASRRVGLDPLADEYLKLGADKHAMEYVASGSEHMPFETGAFDIVCSFNSLDHVADLDQVIREIIRVVKPNGLFLLITDVNHDPKPAEPTCFSWDIVDRFTAHFDLEQVGHWEKSKNGIYQSLLAPKPYSHDDLSKRYGILTARLRRKAS
jgi:ubiquinone/menaquinone biosynthesis C-methylase UbiE